MTVVRNYVNSGTPRRIPGWTKRSPRRDPDTTESGDSGAFPSPIPVDSDH